MYHFLLSSPLAALPLIARHALPLQHGSKVFTFFYGMFNIYVLLLAFCYTPVGTVYGDLSGNDSVRKLLFCTPPVP